MASGADAWSVKGESSMCCGWRVRQGLDHALSCWLWQIVWILFHEK